MERVSRLHTPLAADAHPERFASSEQPGAIVRSQAAGRLRMPLAAWRWAVGSGQVPPADTGPWSWSCAVVGAAGADGGRGGGGLADGGPGGAVAVSVRVTASAVVHLVRAGLLVYLGGDVDVHPHQVATLARRRDLPALLDRHVPLGPYQRAVRLGVRRVDLDQVVRLGWVALVEIDYKRQGGVTTVPLYSGESVALLPVVRLVRPHVAWRAVYAVRAGRRSPLAALNPVVPGRDRVLLGEAGRAAVMNYLLFVILGGSTVLRVMPYRVVSVSRNRSAWTLRAVVPEGGSAEVRPKARGARSWGSCGGFCDRC